MSGKFIYALEDERPLFPGHIILTAGGAALLRLWWPLELLQLCSLIISEVKRSISLRSGSLTGSALEQCSRLRSRDQKPSLLHLVETCISVVKTFLVPPTVPGLLSYSHSAERQTSLCCSCFYSCPNLSLKKVKRLATKLK